MHASKDWGTKPLMTDADPGGHLPRTTPCRFCTALTKTPAGVVVARMPMGT